MAVIFMLTSLIVCPTVLPAHPIDLRIGPGSEPFHQLAGMLHQVADRVDLQLQGGQSPVAMPFQFFQLQPRHPFQDVSLAKGQVLQDRFLVIRLEDLLYTHMQGFYYTQSPNKDRPA